MIGSGRPAGTDLQPHYSAEFAGFWLLVTHPNQRRSRRPEVKSPPQPVAETATVSGLRSMLRPSGRRMPLHTPNGGDHDMHT